MLAACEINVGGQFFKALVCKQNNAVRDRDLRIIGALLIVLNFRAENEKRFVG